jgi:serine/threonine-protein kinase RsbW
MKNFVQRESMFIARLAAWRSARQFLETFCEVAALERAPSLRLNLILEELFTNTVNHGHRGDSDFFIWMSLSTQPDGVRITYTDQAPPFNPVGAARTQFALPIEERKIGGLGIYLTTELTSRAEYGYFYGRNQVRLLLPA